jgi:hypothetical protein
MHKEELANWQRIKDHMEEMGTTDNYFYKRAVTILADGKDPMQNFNPGDPTEHP